MNWLLQHRWAPGVAILTMAVILAAARLTLHPPLIVADEPTGNLDSRTAQDIFDLFDQVVGQGKTMLIVTHDKELAKRVPRNIEIRDGKITRDEGQLSQ